MKTKEQKLEQLAELGLTYRGYPAPGTPWKRNGVPISSEDVEKLVGFRVGRG